LYGVTKLRYFHEGLNFVVANNKGNVKWRNEGKRNEEEAEEEEKEEEGEDVNSYWMTLRETEILEIERGFTRLRFVQNPL